MYILISSSLQSLSNATTSLNVKNMTKSAKRILVGGSIFSDWRFQSKIFALSMLKIMKGEEGEEGGSSKKFLKMFGRIFYCFSYCIFSSSNSNSKMKS